MWDRVGPFLMVAVGGCLLLGGCCENNPFCSCDDEEDLPGPCIHMHTTPLIEIKTVRDAQTQELLDRVHIGQVRYDGYTIPCSELLWSEHYGVIQEDTLLVGDVPCGFGSEPGVYRLVISSPGYLSQTIEFEATYAWSEGGCPSYDGGATQIDITLTSEN